MLSRLVKLLLALACRAADILAEIAGRRCGRPVPGRLVVLCYHSVPDRLAERFRCQMDVLSRTAVVLPPDFSGRLAPGGRYVMITFDDGCENVVRNALPELAKRAMPCAFFIVSDALGGLPRWIQDPRDPQYGERILDVRALGRLDPAQVAVGSHGASHRSFRGMSAADAREELDRSRSELKTRTGREIDFFAFPHGEHDSASEKLAFQAGYRRLFGLSYAVIEERLDAALLTRFDADPADWPIEFRLKLLGAYRWLPAAFRIKRRLKALLGATRRPGGGGRTVGAS